MLKPDSKFSNFVVYSTIVLAGFAYFYSVSANEKRIKNTIRSSVEKMYPKCLLYQATNTEYFILNPVDSSTKKIVVDDKTGEIKEQKLRKVETSAILSSLK